MAEPQVTIIILNWNNFQDTIECLASLRKLSYKNFKVLVVDNGSKNESVNRLRKYIKSELLIPLPKNLGFTGGTNVGIKEALKAKTDYLLLLNNDTTVKPDLLTKLTNALKADKKLGIVGAVIHFFNDPQKIWFAGGNINLQEGSFSHEYHLPKLGKNTFDTDYVTGCCMLFSADLIKKIGFFDEQYESYVEDVDFNFRAKQAGYRLAIVPSTVVLHKVSASTGGDLNPRKEYLKARNQMIFARKLLRGHQQQIFIQALIKKKLAEAVKFVSWKQLEVAASVLRGLMAGTLYSS